ncbi:MAG: hypothetical protein P1V97_13060 [Planctomycetota bacterium]|nr:hypothetical protein [Planctomycetota bacterium]
MPQGFGFNDQNSINELTGKETPPEKLLTLTLPYFERSFAVEKGNIDDFYNLGRRLKIPEIRYRLQLAMGWPKPSCEDALAFYEVAHSEIKRPQSGLAPSPLNVLPKDASEAKKLVQSAQEAGLGQLGPHELTTALYASTLCRADLHKDSAELAEIQHTVDLVFNEALSVLFAIYVLNSSGLELPQSPGPIEIKSWQKEEIEVAIRGLSSVFPSDFNGRLRNSFRFLTAYYRLLLGRFEDAERDLHRYFEQDIHRDTAENLDSRLFLLRAYIYWQQDHFRGLDNILSLHDKKIQREAVDSGILKLRALRAYQSGSWSKACDALKKVLKNDPESLASRHDLAYVYFKLLKPAVTREILEHHFKNEALDYLKDLDDNGQDRNIRLFYASCLQHSGDSEQAYRLVKEMVQFDNEDWENAELKHFAGLFAFEAGYEEQAHNYFLEAYETLTEIKDDSPNHPRLTLQSKVRASLYFSLAKKLCQAIDNFDNLELDEKVDALQESLIQLRPLSGVFKEELTDFGFSLFLGYLFQELKNGFQPKGQLGPNWLDSASPGSSKVEIYQCYRALSERRIKSAFQHEWSSRDLGQSRVPLYLILLILQAVKKLPKQTLQSLLDQFGISSD